MITVDKFLGIIKDNKHIKFFKLGRIDTDYTSGKPRVQFDGEYEPSIKQYPYLSSYTPAASDRVLLAVVSGTYVILGKVI